MFKFNLKPCLLRQEITVTHSIGDAADISFLSAVRTHYHSLERWYSGGDLSRIRQGIKTLPFVVVAINGEKDLGFNLTQAVQSCGRTDIGGAGGPYSANAGSGQHGSSRLDHIGHIGNHPVARGYSHIPEGLCQARHSVVEFPVAHPGRHLVFRFEYEGRAVVTVSQEVLGEVHSGSNEPLRARHLLRIIDYCVVALGTLDIGKVPHSSPEVADVLYRPVIEVPV